MLKTLQMVLLIGLISFRQLELMLLVKSHKCLKGNSDALTIWSVINPVTYVANIFHTSDQRISHTFTSIHSHDHHLKSHSPSSDESSNCYCLIAYTSYES